MMWRSGKQKARKGSHNALHYLAEVLLGTLQMQCFRFSVQVSIIPMIMAVVIFKTNEEYDFLKDIIPDDSVYNNMRTLISLCIVFHTAQSYSRFMTGLTLVYQLVGELHEAAALLVTFAVHSNSQKGAKDTKANNEQTQGFLDTLVRLCSMMFALVLAELEEESKDGVKRGLDYNIIDPEGLDDHTVYLIEIASDKTVCVYQRLLDLMMDAYSKGVISVQAPLFTRCFQELGNAMIKFHECLKFKDAPFPFPFMFVTDTLLMVYSFSTPFMYAHWCAGPGGAGFFTFISVICTWLLHSVAEELENPFGRDAGDLKAEKLTKELNHQLLALLEQANAPAPHPKDTAAKDLFMAHRDLAFRSKVSKSFNDAFGQGRSSLDKEAGREGGLSPILAHTNQTDDTRDTHETQQAPPENKLKTPSAQSSSALQGVTSPEGCQVADRPPDEPPNALLGSRESEAVNGSAGSADTTVNTSRKAAGSADTTVNTSRETAGSADTTVNTSREAAGSVDTTVNTSREGRDGAEAGSRSSQQAQRTMQIRGGGRGDEADSQRDRIIPSSPSASQSRSREHGPDLELGDPRMACTVAAM